MALALLLTLTEPEPQHAEEFNAWYDDEHMAERLSIPGFLSARRWISTVAPHRYLATYELTSFDVFQSPDYLAHYGDNQTPWSKRNLGRLKVFKRWACVQALPGGLEGHDAAAIFFSAFDAPPEHLQTVLQWYDQEHLPMLAKHAGVSGARRFVAQSGEPRNVALYEINDPGLPEQSSWRASADTDWAKRVVPLVVPGRLRETFRAYPRTWQASWIPQ